MTAAFHWYGLEWTESEFRFFVDGTLSNKYDNHVVHEEMYILANLAIGGRWPGDPLPSFTSTAMHIDYIHAYSVDPNATAATINTSAR